MIRFTIKGDFHNTEKFMQGAEKILPSRLLQIFNKYGREGLEALQFYTPKDTEETANSWMYETTSRGIVWYNSKVTTNGTPLAILLQYGHGTRSGVYVQGIDYINPALKPLFERIGDDIWKEVKSL